MISRCRRSAIRRSRPRKGHRPCRHQRALQRECGEVRDGGIASGIGRFDRLGLVARAGRMHRGVGERQRHGERLRPQPAAVAARAFGRGHVLHHVLAIALGLGVLERVAQPVEDAVESRAADLVARRTVEQQLLLVLGQRRERLLEIDLVLVGRELDQSQQILRRRSRAPSRRPAAASTSP